MNAFITTIGEPTTDLCEWSLTRNGFDVTIISGHDTLAKKLERIYNMATTDFLRVDADIIVNRFMNPDQLYELGEEVWWWQFLTFDWFKQDTTHSMAFIRQPAIHALKKNIGRFSKSLRPETEVSRIDELHNPRRMDTFDKQIMGIHGYANDLESARVVKQSRLQTDLYDFELAQELNRL